MTILEKFLTGSGVSLENRTEEKGIITFMQKDETQYKGDTETRKVIAKGLTYIYYERKTPDFGEENLMKRKGLLQKPKSFQFHMPLEMTEKTEKGASEEFIIEGFASTGEVDRDGDIVSPDSFGKALDGFMENPILCYMHDWTDPIGAITYARIVSAGQELSVGKRRMAAPTGGLFVRASISGSASKIRQLISEGVLKAFSIGFMIKDARYDEVTDVRVITDIELYEISVVSIPSNRRSLFSVSKALEIGTDVLCEACSVEGVKEAQCCSHHKEEDPDKDSEVFRARLVSAVKEKALVLKGLSPTECVEQVCKFGNIDLSKKEWFNEAKKKEEAVTTAEENPPPAVTKVAGAQAKEMHKEMMGVTASQESIGEEDVQNHQHDLHVFVDIDDMGQVMNVEGMAEQGNNDHSHPVREMGKTEAVDGHYHTFTKLDPVGGEGTPMRVSPPVPTKAKTYKVPKDIAELLVEVAVQKSDDSLKILNAVEYLEDLVTHGPEHANKMFYVRQLKQVAERWLKTKYY
jgi:HK97 family phage prohead protease